LQRRAERAGQPMKPVRVVFAVGAVIAGFAIYFRPRYGTLEAFIGILVFAAGLSSLLNGMRHRGQNSK
jgi:uncharacterized membrane protein